MIFTKYGKKSCQLCSEEYYSFKYISNFAFALEVSFILSGCFWPLWALMEQLFFIYFVKIIL